MTRYIPVAASSAGANQCLAGGCVPSEAPVSADQHPESSIQHLIALAAVLAGAFHTSSSPAASIRCAGVVANSGEAGETVVRFGQTRDRDWRGMGVVYDRFGTLWDRGGKGTLNRYALDGRLVATYGIPGGSSGEDQITSIGDTIILLIRGQIYRITASSASGESASKLGVAARHISFGSRDGRIACEHDKELFLLSADGTRTDVCTLPFDARWIEQGPDGTIWAVDSWRMRRVHNGALVEEKDPPKCAGERPQLLGGYWYGHAWHGTIRRFDEDFRPVPGVVLGGASGSFIGHLEQNSELINGRGMAKINDTLYAVSGFLGVMHLLEWDGSKRTMNIVRRIGAINNVGGLGLDRDGRIWARAGDWPWNAQPDTPHRCGVNSGDIGQAVMLDNDRMAAPCTVWGEPGFCLGKLGVEISQSRLSKQKCPMPRGYCATAFYRSDRTDIMLVANAKSEAAAYGFHPNARNAHEAYRGHLGGVTLATSPKAQKLATFAMKDGDTLLAAADGHVIELARDGRNWRERKRWSSWGVGADESFGAEIHIVADEGRLWVSDTERHRVVCLDLGAGRPIAAFGATDTAGDDLAHLSQPRAIMARAHRAVVFDSANQRIVKLELE